MAKNKEEKQRVGILMTIVIAVIVFIVTATAVTTMNILNEKRVVTCSTKTTESEFPGTEIYTANLENGVISSVESALELDREEDAKLYAAMLDEVFPNMKYEKEGNTIKLGAEASKQLIGEDLDEIIGMTPDEFIEMMEEVENTTCKR